MATRVAINGFGRIGRALTRLIVKDHWDEIEIVAVNARSDAATYAHLFEYDSVHGRFQGPVEHAEGLLKLGGRDIQLTNDKNFEWRWGELGVDLVFETTGKLTKAADAKRHIERGARKVLVSAPAKEADVTVVPGVNSEALDVSSQEVISSASCTTQCLAHMAKIMMDSFGWETGVLNTVHAYTMSQRILDGSQKDLRRARAAAMSIIPTTTGAARAVGSVVPELSGKIDGMAMRVPVPDGSISDLTVLVERDVTVEEVNEAYRSAVQGKYQETFAYTDKPLVSVDIIGDTHAGVFDSLSTMVLGKRHVKALAWYDNEWGFANQFLRLALMTARQMSQAK